MQFGKFKAMDDRQNAMELAHLNLFSLEDEIYGYNQHKCDILCCYFT